jgi:hypothetical protein
MKTAAGAKGIDSLAGKPGIRAAVKDERGRAAYAEAETRYRKAWIGSPPRPTRSDRASARAARVVPRVFPRA